MVITKKYDKTIILRNILAKIINRNTAFPIAYHWQEASIIDEKATQFVRKTYEISIFLVSLCALLIENFRNSFSHIVTRLEP